MSRYFCMLLISMVFAFSSVQAGELVSPWVTTDRTVDCSSYESIVKDVIKTGMTDEQKAIAMYDFFRQMVYHYMNTPESRNPIKNINVIGYTLCGSQGTCMKGLLNAAGIKARVVSNGGHTFYEAFYDGRWHGFDTFAHFYIYTRGEGDKRYIASYEEMRKDPSLISDAVKEGRACPNICPCGDKPIWFAKKTQVLGNEPLTSDWSVKDYSLREGEEMVRTWWPRGYSVPGSFRAQHGSGPYHTCGSQDKKNPWNIFKFFEPYGIRKYETVSVSYRHYFNGWMNFSPDLSSEPYSAAIAAGELVIPVKCPFYITGAKISFKADCPTEADSLKVLVEVDGKWQNLAVANKKGLNEYTFPINQVVRGPVGRHTYRIKFSAVGKSVLKNIYLKTIFTHNAMSAPHLMPGKNKVTVAVNNADSLKSAPLTLIYRYKEAPSWTDLKVLKKVIKTSPYTFGVTLPETKSLPQMKDMTLRCGKLAWTPLEGDVANKIICDFSKKDSIKKWSANEPLVLSHDGTGLLITSSETAAGNPQASLNNLKENWNGYETFVLEVENLGKKPQIIAFRARSNDSNKERTDIMQTIPLGKFVMRVPLAGFGKTKLDAITKIYVMILQIPEEGCKVRVNKIYLEPKEAL